MTVFREMSSKLMMELIGTFILIFTIQTSVSLEETLAPLAIGGVLICIVFAGGPISGAHYNPAVSLAIALRGASSYVDMLLYWVSQLIGGVLGAFFGTFVSKNSVSFMKGKDVIEGQAILAEIIFTFILCFVVLATATNSKVANNHYYGLAIGLVVLSGAITVGPISGGAFNPAVAIGLSIAKGFKYFSYALFVSIGNLIGAILASFAFYFTVPEEFTKSSRAENSPLV